MDKENTLYMDLDYGRVVIEMMPEVAPKHVARIKELTRKGFYDGVKFHRVIPGFMAQTGDPTGTGMGGSGQKLNAEFNDVSHQRGVVSMARAMDPNSADSQFFICFDDASFLDKQYTVWGRTICRWRKRPGCRCSQSHGLSSRMSPTLRHFRTILHRE